MKHAALTTPDAFNGQVRRARLAAIGIADRFAAGQSARDITHWLENHHPAMVVARRDGHYIRCYAVQVAGADNLASALWRWSAGVLDALRTISPDTSPEAALEHRAWAEGVIRTAEGRTDATLDEARRTLLTHRTAERP